MDNKMTHQNTLLTQTKMCPKGFDDEHLTDFIKYQAPHSWGFLFVG